jgi:hypothetical protein
MQSKRDTQPEYGRKNHLLDLYRYGSDFAWGFGPTLRPPAVRKKAAFVFVSQPLGTNAVFLLVFNDERWPRPPIRFGKLFGAELPDD